MKIELRAYDRVRRLKKMDPEDVKSLKATEALYEDQLGLELSPQQKQNLEELAVKREEARVALAQVNGGEAGNEIGSNAHKAAAEPNLTPGGLPSLPQRNEELTKGFRVPTSAGAH